MDSFEQDSCVNIDETVSIIIPVYNMMQYLDKCMNSIVAQSYPEIEILLVDDGSTDGSGALCDQWAESDSRIRVIHRENGGLSDARNAGIDAASGKYLAFVDSDDYISENMIAKLVEAAKENDAEISICNFLCVDEEGIPVPEKNRILPIQNEVLSGPDGIERFFSVKGWYYITVWNKLYRKELFSAIRFPKGKIHEDEFVAHHLFGKCRRIACCRDACYYYVQRSGSIIHSRNCRSNLHAAEAYLDRACYLYEHCLPHVGQAYLKSAMFLAEAWPGLRTSPTLKGEMTAFLDTFRRNRHLRESCTRKEKIQIAIVSCSPGLYHLVFQNSMRRAVKKALQKDDQAFEMKL